MHLTNKIVVVTGASKGIGLAVSQAFAAEGAFVVAGARHNSPELQALEAAGSAAFIATDLATPDGPRALIAAAAERGRIDILVNNAGAVGMRFDGILSVTDDEWDAALSKEFGPKGIRVNTISPGPVSTGLWLAEDGVAAKFANASGATPDDVVASVSAGAPTGRFTTPQEVADLSVFLASDRSGNTTGSDVRIDGGYVTTV